MLVPLLRSVIPIPSSREVARRFGKGAGFGLGLAFLMFVSRPRPGFGDVKSRNLPGAA